MSPSKEQNLDCIEIDPKCPPRYSVICLHGLGAHGSDLVPIVSELKLPPEMPLRFVFPHAPVIPITINNGYQMRAWYDIVSYALEEHVDRDSISNSVLLVEKLIKQEKNRGIPTSNIILAGFSQGAVMALMTSLFYPEKLGGIIALSGYLPVTAQELEKASSANKQTAIFLAHGTEDPVVPYHLGKHTYEFLLKNNYSVEWHHYPIAHTISLDEIHDLSAWLQNVLVKKK